jgi:hypothetical protein
MGGPPGRFNVPEPISQSSREELRIQRAFPRFDFGFAIFDFGSGL